MFVILPITSFKICFMHECNKHIVSWSSSFLNLDILSFKLNSNSWLTAQLKKLLQALNQSSGSADGLQMVPKFQRDKHQVKLFLMLPRMFFSLLLNDLLGGLIQRLV